MIQVMRKTDFSHMLGENKKTKKGPQTTLQPGPGKHDYSPLAKTVLMK